MDAFERMCLGSALTGFVIFGCRDLDIVCCELEGAASVGGLFHYTPLPVSGSSSPTPSPTALASQLGDSSYQPISGAGGELLPLVEGSTRAVAQVRTHAGICRVTRYAFSMP
jgi:hypothetical protein